MMSGSQCCAYIRREFQLKHLGFTGVHHARFCYFQWRVPVGVVLLYRFILAAYCTFWLFYTTVTGSSLPLNGTNIPTVAFLTTWTYFVLTFYLILHFLVCLIYVCKRGHGNLWKSLTAENHRRLFHELNVQPSLWGSREYEIVHATDSDDEEDGVTTHTSLPWILNFVWIMYNIASVGCIMVTLIFWTLLFPQMHLSDLELSINIQLHGITSVIIILEHILSGLPYRLLHYIYPLIYGVIYLVFSGIYYAVDHRHILYPHVLDWSEPGTTAIVVCLTALVVLPLIQFFLFALYKIRLFIFNRCNPEEL